MPVTLVTVPDDFAMQQLDRGKKRRGPVSLVVMGHRAAASLLQRQTGLSAIQGLNLALLVHAKHDCFVRRIQVEADDVSQLFEKLRVP